MLAVRAVEHGGVFAVSQIANEMKMTVQEPIGVASRQVWDTQCFTDTQEHVK